MGNLDGAIQDLEMFDNWKTNPEVRGYMLRMLELIINLLGAQCEVSTQVSGDGESPGWAAAASGSDDTAASEGGQANTSLESEWAILENGGKITLSLAPYEKEEDDAEEGGRTPPPKSRTIPMW